MFWAKVYNLIVTLIIENIIASVIQNLPFHHTIKDNNKQ